MDPSLVVTLFHELSDAIQMINSTFTFPLMFVIFHLFIFNLISSYNHLWMFAQDIENFDLLLITDGLQVLLNYVLQSLLTHSSSTTTQEAEETAVIVSKIVNKIEISKAHQKVFKSFLMQKQYRNLKLQTSFFTINWKMMLTVSLTVFTYDGT